MNRIADNDGPTRGEDRELRAIWLSMVLGALIMLLPRVAVAGVAIIGFLWLVELAPKLTEPLVGIPYRWLGVGLAGGLCGAAFLQVDHPGWMAACGLISATLGVLVLLRGGRARRLAFVVNGAVGLIVGILVAVRGFASVSN